ncbi:MAG: hypothetical protein WAW23_00255 [Candidatus Methanoperedens sp.]
MPQIMRPELWEQSKHVVFKPPETEKKGIMCTVCKKVHWGITNIGQLNRCRKCRNTDLTKFINVSSADFNKYSGRFLWAPITSVNDLINCLLTHGHHDSPFFIELLQEAGVRWYKGESTEVARVLTQLRNTGYHIEVHYSGPRHQMNYILYLYNTEVAARMVNGGLL